MRFACPYCQTKYQIPAEKLTAGVVRVQCKICTKIIAVRNPKTAGETGDKSASDQAPPSVDPNQHWHFVLGEEKTGPHPIEVLMNAIASGEVTGETYAWRPGMEAWEQAKDIGDLAGNFSQPSTPAPPSQVPGAGPSRAERPKRSGGQAPRAPAGQGRRGGRFTRVGAKSRTPGAPPKGAPRSRVVGPTRRFPAPGAPGAANRPGTAAEKPYLKPTQQEEQAPEETVAQQPVIRDEPMVPQEVSSPPAVPEEEKDPASNIQENLSSQEAPSDAPVGEESEEVLSFDATLPDGGALDSLAGDLDQEPEEEAEREEFEATLEDNQLSLLGGALDEEEEAFIPAVPESTERTDEPGLTDPPHDSPVEEPVEEEPVDEAPEEEEPVEEAPEEEPVDEAPEEEEPVDEAPEEEEPVEEAPEEDEPVDEAPEEEPVDEAPEEEPVEEAPEEEPVEEAPEENEQENQEEEELILEQEGSENELELDDPSNPQTAGPTLPFHLDEQQRTSLDELFSPLDSEPVPPDSIIRPFSKSSDDQESSPDEETPIEDQESSSEEGAGEEETHEAGSPELDDEPTIMEDAPDELDSPSQSQLSLQAVVVLDDEDDEEEDADFLETDFFSVEDDAADEDSLSFDLAPPDLPSKEEIREGKNELKKLLSEAAGEQKQEKSISSEEIKRAKEEVKKLGMDAPSSRPSGKRLSVVAAALIGVVVMMIIFSSQDDNENVAPPPPVSMESDKVFENGQIKRPSYEEPLQVEKDEEANPEGEEAEEEELEEEEEDSNVPAWKANFEEDDTDVPSKKASPSSKSAVKATVKEEVKKEGKPLDNRALAGLMGKDDGANLKGLKDDTKKALSGMKTATEVSSDVLNKLFLKRSPQIKRCANRHNLTGKVVVKFAVAVSGETSNTQVIATPTPPTSSGIECIEKIVDGWKFPPQDQETIFSKILVF